MPCFTSVQRLTAWVEAADLPRAAPSEESQFAESGRRWQRAGDARVVPHLVVPAVGLARRLPSGLGLALNADGANGVPLYPESVSCLARLACARSLAADRPCSARPGLALRAAPRHAHRGRGRSRAPAGRAEGAAGRGGPACGRCGSPGTPPAPGCRSPARARAWSSRSPSTTPEAGGPRRRHRRAGTRPRRRSRSASPSRSTSPSPARSSAARRRPPSPDDPSPTMIDEWIARNTRPFYTRD